MKNELEKAHRALIIASQFARSKDVAGYTDNILIAEGQNAIVDLLSEQNSNKATSATEIMSGDANVPYLLGLNDKLLCQVHSLEDKIKEMEVQGKKNRLDALSYLNLKNRIEAHGCLIELKSKVWDLKTTIEIEQYRARKKINKAAGIGFGLGALLTAVILLPIFI